MGDTLAYPCASGKELFRRADAMLYLAKDSGRNRVVGMVEELRLPMLYSELMDLQAFLRLDRNRRPIEYPVVRASEDQALAYEGYNYKDYIEKAGD